MNFKTKGKIVIGLTGDIAAGKSEFLKIAGKFGAATICADELCADELKRGNKGYKAAIKIFGKTILDKNANIKKKDIASVIFRNKKIREKFERVLHPLVLKKAKKTTTDSKSKIIFFAVPLLFENKLNESFDFVLYIAADKKIRLERAKQRGWTVAEFRRRSLAQYPTAKKLKMAHIAYFNNKGIKEMRAFARGLIMSLR